MDESTWLASVDPEAMLSWLQTEPKKFTHNFRLSDRLLRLLACAYVYQVWHLLTEERSRRAVEVASLYADGLATDEQRTAAWSDAWRISDGPVETVAQFAALMAAGTCHHRQLNLVYHSRKDYCFTPATQATAMRCIFGNPFQSPTVPAWRCRVCRKLTPRSYCVHCVHTPTVRALAQTAYDERDFALLPLLADALEEAGLPAEAKCPLCNGHGHFNKGNDNYNICRQEQEEFRTGKIGCSGSGRIPNPILRHLREDKVHARGCHVLDCLLGRE